MTGYPHLGAFESTHIFGSGEDVLGTTRHIERWRDDLDMLLACGIRELRYSIPWHRIERRPGSYDWRWLDGPMRFMARTGMRIIADLLHHTSFPSWLEQGFANPEFPCRYAEFVRAFAERYPWVRDYTVFNEPLPTVLFCSSTGIWYPYLASDDDFARMVLHAGTAISLAATAVRRVNRDASFVHVDTCEHHQALDRRSEPAAQFANHRRFLFHDLILGRIGRAHPLAEYLMSHGFTADDIAWFQDCRAPIDLLGLDYYIHSEMSWRWNRRRNAVESVVPCSRPRGFAAVAGDYIARFGLPVFLAETNLRGTIHDRITWLRFMEGQCEELAARGVDFRGFCWYPSIDSTDWDSICTRCCRHVDPQGIWLLDEARWHRHRTELSDVYGRLARGEIRAEDLPAYAFQAPLDRDLAGFRRLMRTWQFIEPARAA